MVYEFCKNLYANRVDEAAREAAAGNGFPEGFALPRPNSIPPERWEALSEAQRAAKYLGRWSKRVRSQADPALDSPLPLTESDLIRMAYAPLALSERAAASIAALLGVCEGLRKNPTIDALAAAAAKADHEGRPLELVMSQCLSKADGVRPRKLEFFLDGARGDCATFIAGVEAVGWGPLRQLVRAMPMPVRATIFLGDMDTLTIDGAARWGSAAMLDRYAAEVSRVSAETSERAAAFFGDLPVEVRRWSEMYGPDRFYAYLERAERAGGWDSSPLACESKAMYLDQWGYRRIQRERGIDPSAMERFVRGDLIRTAAQYRLEADIAIKRGAVQVWAEKVPNRWWPVEVSNYDGAGYAGSISFV